MPQKQKNLLLSQPAINLAREAVVEVDDDGIGQHVGVTIQEDNVVTHRFQARVPGYRGWEWHAVLARAAGSSIITVNEVALVPGEQALKPPRWVPYSQRVRPGDLGPGDIMPPAADDPRLNNAGQFTEYGVTAAQKRWRTGQRGPKSQMATAAALKCRTCAFLIPLAENFKDHFGVCANELSADGEVVHCDYGCGAHSQTRAVEEEKADCLPFDDERPVY